MSTTITKTPAEIRTDFLRTIKNGLMDIGVSAPNVSENSDYYVLGNALADQISALYNNIIIQGDALLPDTATGTDLDRLMTMFGLSRRLAGPCYGQITIISTSTTLVVTGSELVSSTGGRYQVITGGIYDGSSTGMAGLNKINISSIDVGSATNLGKGEVLTWVSPPFATQTTSKITVSLSGGIDAEDDESARTRLLAHLQSPPGSGNWQQVKEIAEASSSLVNAAFIYPAANGPSTLHVAVVGYSEPISKSRVIDDITFTITPTIKGKLPDYVDVVVTSVVDVPVDISIKLIIPESTSASIPGVGGGWLDGSPFPAVDNSTYWFASVSATTVDTSFTINALPSTSVGGVLPTKGTRISWIDRTKSPWTVKTATIQTVSGTGPFVVTIDIPFVNITVNDWIFPASENAQTYLDAILNSFNILGAGEKVSSSSSLFVRASRKPRPPLIYPNIIDAGLLKSVINSGDEVLTADFYYRDITTPATQVLKNVNLTPAIPTAITNAPKIFIPRQIGFYRAI